MEMQLFEHLRFKVEQVDWSCTSEFGLLDALTEAQPELIKIASADVLRDSKSSVFGRKDMPSFSWTDTN